MSENVRKLVGVAIMAVLVVVGVVVSSGDDMDYTRNYAYELKNVQVTSLKADVPDDGTLNLDTGPINKTKKEGGPISQVGGPLGKADYGQFRYQPDNDLTLVKAIGLGGQEGEAMGGQEGEAMGGQEGEALGGQEGEAFRSERRNVVAFGNSSVASVIIDDNHFRDVDDPAGALRKLAEGKEPLMAEDQALGIRGPISKVVGSDRPTLAIQTDDGLTLGPLGGDGVFVSIQDEALIDVDTSEYTEVEWTLVAKSLLEASENLQRLAKQLDIWTTGGATR